MCGKCSADDTVMLFEDEPVKEEAQLGKEFGDSAAQGSRWPLQANWVMEKPLPCMSPLRPEGKIPFQESDEAATVCACHGLSALLSPELLSLLFPFPVWDGLSSNHVFAWFSGKIRD